MEQTPQFNLHEATDAPDMSRFKTAPDGFSTVAPDEQSVTVYPNPSKGLFTITLGNSAKGTIEVYDMMGRNIKNMELNTSEKEYKLDLSGFSKGVYLLNMTIDGERSTKKIVIE